MNVENSLFYIYPPTASSFRSQSFAASINRLKKIFLSYILFFLNKRLGFAPAAARGMRMYELPVILCIIGFAWTIDKTKTGLNAEPGHYTDS